MGCVQDKEDFWPSLWFSVQQRYLPDVITDSDFFHRF